MILFLFCLCCVLQPLFHYMSVFGKKEPAKRFIKEEGTKFAIFGSYSYDPIKDVFESSADNATHTDHQVINSSYILSTAVGDLMTQIAENITSLSHERYHFRGRTKEVRSTLLPNRPTKWWEQANLLELNSTLKERKF